MTSDDLLTLARRKADAGLVPCERPARVYEVPAVVSRVRCVSVPIDRGDIEYELEFERPVTAAAPRNHFHFDCHTAWATICVNRSPRATP